MGMKGRGMTGRQEPELPIRNRSVRPRKRAWELTAKLYQRGAKSHSCYQNTKFEYYWTPYLVTPPWWWRRNIFLKEPVILFIVSCISKSWAQSPVWKWFPFSMLKSGRHCKSLYFLIFRTSFPKQIIFNIGNQLGEKDFTEWTMDVREEYDWRIYPSSPQRRRYLQPRFRVPTVKHLHVLPTGPHLLNIYIVSHRFPFGRHKKGCKIKPIMSPTSFTTVMTYDFNGQAPLRS